ncbi:MAG: outer membrane protein transport protein [Planctomycetes bacterium]|nr:outer membrane protein transport protein [Planctomycetota bacterium]
MLALLLGVSPALAQQGLVLSGVGPVNRSMGGASTAAPINASGAIHWNPASIVGLERSEFDFGVELLFPQPTLSSSIAAGALGGGIPPIALSGSTESDGGAFTIPTMGLVYKPEESCWTFGIGIFGTGGFGVNYPQDSSNPVLGPAPPNGIGLGPVFSNLQVLQIAPTAAYQITDHLSVGFAPTVSLAQLSLDPAVFASPNANGSYPSATHGRMFWGIGCQGGVYYTSDSCWNFGASIKSTQFFETFRWHSVSSTGVNRTVKFDADYPMILSFGVGYTGFERWVLAADFRWLDYENTDGLRSSGFDSTGAVKGLGWDSIFALALGAQYQWSDRVSLRIGYSFNENPIDDSQAFINAASPVIAEHTLYLGASYKLTDAWKVSVAYVHAFENSISGPIVSPAAGPLAGTSAKSEMFADALVVGVSVQF